MNWLDELKKRNTLSTNSDEGHDKHTAMLNAITHYAKPRVQSKLTDVEIIKSTKNTKLLLILMPSWSINFPPYNLARLNSVAKSAGYTSKMLDINVKSKNYLFAKKDRISFYPWDGARDWCWIGENYYNLLHDHLEPFFLEQLEEIIKYEPDVIGFTTYYCNIEPVKWMAKKIRERLPEVKIIIGGSNLQSNSHVDSLFDCGVVGEGELILLEVLDEIENGNFNKENRLRSQPEKQRLNLSSVPIPDYDDIDFNEYSIPNGVTSELSRGCIAKCSFCEETHFWKYRQRQASDVITEIEYLYNNKGTDVVWFLDSLVNGNLKELRAFAKAIIAKGLKIKWVGYCRNDERMDLEYYKDLADSGCFMLSYGCESASQKVLDDLNKGTTTLAMEENFKNGAKVGIKAHTNWIVGFSTEGYQDFADTMTFIWRNRNNGIVDIAAGTGFGVGMATLVGQNPDRYNLLHHKYIGNWITKDFKMGKLHMLSRVKSFAVFLQNLISNEYIVVPNRPNLKAKHYYIKWNNPHQINEIEYETFDYNIIKADINPFANTLVNEMFVIFRMLWRMRGGYKAKIIFDEKLDLEEFSDKLAGPYWAEHNFEIDDYGNWSASFKFKYVQPPSLVEDPDPHKPRSPFFAQDYSRYSSNAAIRARTLAKPSWGMEGRSHEQFAELVEEEKRLNRTIDFSFKYEWSGSGDWSDYQQYERKLQG